MPYITREDGEHFVIPSYRDVLTVKQTSQLKKEILLLSQSYGEYITLQKKSATQYEIAFSPDKGYLLGESIWHNFNKPLDLIYCEAIPNTSEAILVIVKSGSVYLDGSFPLESIPEELIIFLTQQNNFEIYVYGDVPVSKDPEAGKFSFEPSSVKSFTELDKPVFPTLPLLKSYQLQLVDPVLKGQGIGVFPTTKIVAAVIVVAIGWFTWSYFTAEKETVTVAKQEVNPYQSYMNILGSPAPDMEVKAFNDRLTMLRKLPGWYANDIKYIHSTLTVSVLSAGGKVADLYSWSRANRANILIKKTGFYVTMFVSVPSRPLPNTIMPTNSVIVALVDRISDVYPGNHLTLENPVKKGLFNQQTIKVSFSKISPMLLDLIGQQFNGLPLILHDITTSLGDDGNLTGSITVEALGN